jgi:hypothetical protein|eukprot:SAG25_NODE_372_length_8977_cov_25.225839_6_plen_85_part_00
MQVLMFIAFEGWRDRVGERQPIPPRLVTPAEFAPFVERALEKRKKQEAMMAEAKKALKVLQKARVVGVVTTLSRDGKHSIILCE